LINLLTAVLLLVALFVPATSALAACDGAIERSGPITLQVGPTSRFFVLKVPSGADGRTPSPVLFAFHPFGMNAQYMEARVSSRAWPDAIMVYPEGLRGGGGSPSWQSRPGDLGDRDLAFFDAMLAWLDAHECIDRARVFVMGYSNGAALASTLACARASVIAGAAMAAGRPACPPDSARPVIIGHGLRDQTIAYQQASQAALSWSKANGCAAPPKSGVPGCSAASSCTSAPLRMCTYEGGHEYNTGFTKSMAEFFKEVGGRK
jgi:polyhydroxybutyrate depolymerase